MIHTSETIVDKTILAYVVFICTRGEREHVYANLMRTWQVQLVRGTSDDNHNVCVDMRLHYDNRYVTDSGSNHVVVSRQAITDNSSLGLAHDTTPKRLRHHIDNM